MIYHCMRYTLDRHKLSDFEAYARRWMEGDEQYRARLSDDPDSQANLKAAEKSQCILTEERSYFYCIE